MTLAGTIYTVVDPRRNRTSITTKFVTTAVEVNGVTFGPDHWLSDGTYIGVSTTTKTTTAIDSFDRTHTL